MMCFFVTMAFLTCMPSKGSYYLHHGFWYAKVFFIAGMIVASAFTPPDVFSYYSQRVVQKSMMRGLPARSFVNDDAVLSSSNNVRGRSGAAAARADMALAVLKAVVSGRFIAPRVCEAAVMEESEL